MKVAAASFRQALIDFDQIVRKRPIDPILGSVLIEFAEEDLTLTAIDVDLKLQIRMDSQTDRPIGEYHKLAIPYKFLKPLTFPGTITTKEIHLSCSNLDLEIQFGKIKQLMPGIATDDFPDFGVSDSDEMKGWFHIGQKEVNDVLDLCSQYASTDPTRTNITGINIRVENNEAIAEGTDGYCWVAQSNFPVISENTFRCIMPSFLPAKLLKLKQRWKQLTIAAHEDCLMVVNETLNMRFQIMTTNLGWNYPQVDHLFDCTTADSIISAINPHDLVRFLKAMDKSYKQTIILTENKHFHVYGVSADNLVPYTCITRRGNGFACAGLNTEKLIQLCAVPKNVKEITFHIKKEFSKPSPIVIEYSTKEHSFIIGLMQVKFIEKTFWYDKRQELINLYSQIPEVMDEQSDDACISDAPDDDLLPESIIAPDDNLLPEGTFDADDDFFPEGFFD